MDPIYLFPEGILRNLPPGSSVSVVNFFFVCFSLNFCIYIYIQRSYVNFRFWLLS
uniref:Uncharacterized protein n=1 Tax=Rhizophora mucronata TaxID=61149 RepID=A0A2P2MBX7_RHIMU